jgi:AraC-like DNA-binding protein
VPEVTPYFQSAQLSVAAYRCTAGPHDRPFLEQHRDFSVSFVRAGTFAYRTGGRLHDLVPGAVMVGRAGDEYTCSHEHSTGDVCVSVHLPADTLDALECDSRRWRSGGVAPRAELVVAAERLGAAAIDPDAGGVDEAAIAFVARYADGMMGGRAARTPTPHDRRRATRAALWIDAHAVEAIGLHDMAAQAGMSPFQFVRTFAAVLGVTPHQYLLRCRMRLAARQLAAGRVPVTEIALASGFADLSNFIRTFRRAAGVPPSEFRKIVQVPARVTALRSPHESESHSLGRVRPGRVARR